MVLVSPGSQLLGNSQVKSGMLLCLLSLCLLVQPTFGQGLMDYQRYYYQNEFNVSKVEDLTYAKAITNYYLYKGSGAKTEKSSYKLVTELPLKLDLYNPNTSSKPGKRAVLILIPGGGRTGCLGVTLCNRKTIKQSGLYSSSAYYISEEGTNYNETADSKARNYAKSGFVVLTLNTRYTYHDKRFEANKSNRWKINGSQIFNDGSAHIENMVVDIKRAVRWLSHHQQISRYNIDPDNIFIQGGSGGAKMASLAAVSPVKAFLADSPLHTVPSHSQYQFEVKHNNLLVAQKPFRGAILFAGDMNGTRHRQLITKDTGALMLWHGTMDRSILHGLAETIEQKCEEVGCDTEFYSLANVQHGKQGAATFEHTDRASTSGGLKTGVRAHLHDFIVNHLSTGEDNRPVLSINQSKVKFQESTGRADIEINLSRAATQDISFIASADQMREVMSGHGTQGKYSLIESHVANDSVTSGPVAYAQGTGVAFENKKNVTGKYAGKTYYTSGPGNGNPVVIAASSNYHHNDFQGSKRVLTIPAGQTTAKFRVTLINDTLYENNECFKVRLLNANGAKIGNSVETITIVDDDNPSAGTSIPSVCKNVKSDIDNNGGGDAGGSGGGGSVTGTSGNNGGGTPVADTVKPVIHITAPTKSSTGPITNTSISIEDNVSILARSVVLRDKSTATVSDFNCKQINPKRVNCSVTITGSGDLMFMATDLAGNANYNKATGYTISSPKAESDIQKPRIILRVPTQISTGPISNTTVIVKDNQELSASDVVLRRDNSAAAENFDCKQTNSRQVDCSVVITGSGVLKLMATDLAGNKVHRDVKGYTINTPAPKIEPDTVRPKIRFTAPIKVSSTPITNVTVAITDNRAVSASRIILRRQTTATVTDFNCVQTSIKRVDCTMVINSSGNVKLAAFDEAGRLTYNSKRGFLIQ